MSFNDDTSNTDFGFRKVKKEEKANLVAKVFKSVAPKYDLMNDLMSFGLHRLWKRLVISRANIKHGDCVLDVASGTCDLAYLLSQKVGEQGLVIASDINDNMLAIGRDKMLDNGVVANMRYLLNDAESLPFKDNSFDCITIAFGLRNVTNKLKALQSMQRILKPGGKLLVLEFSKPTSTILNYFYDFYSFNFIPRLGEFITHDKKSYEYLVESIRKHPNQETLKSLFFEANFDEVNFQNIHGGIVALHIGIKF